MSRMIRPVRRAPTARVARISFADDSGFAAVSDAETRRPPVFSPGGVESMPCEGDSALLLPVGGGELCAGILCDTAGLAPGELRLRSRGGAQIHLRNTGEIVLNGLSITPDGRLIPPPETPAAAKG